MEIDINQLIYFIEICRVGSMSKASASLNISPQGISSSIRRLEDELGAELFYRSARGLSPTLLGNEVLHEAECVIRHVEKIQELSRLQAMGKTNLSIAITAGRFLKLPAQLQKLLITPPDEFSVNLIHDYSTACMELVYKGEAVFGLVYGEDLSAKFSAVELDKAERVFIVNKNHPLAQRDRVTIQDLDKVPMLMPQLKTVPGIAISQLFARNGIELNLAFECMVPHQTVDIISRNDNLVGNILRTDVREYDLENIKILPVEGGEITSAFSFISKKEHKLSLPEQLFKHLILDCYRNF